MSALWTLGCWRDRLRGVVGRGRPRRPTSRSYLMPRVRGFRVRTGDLPYERDVLTQGRARRPWFNARLQTRTPSRPGSTNVHEGGDLLAGGCAYCTSPRPPWSTPDARAVAPHPRGVVAGRRVGSSPWCLGGEVGRVGRRRVRTLCLAFGGSGYEREGYPTNARRSLNGSSEAGAELVRRGV